MDDSLEEVHEELLAWAEGLGIKMHGIRPMRLSGRGFGSESRGPTGSCQSTRRTRVAEALVLTNRWPSCPVVATDKIAEGSEVLTVPSSALRTSATVPSAITNHLPKDMSVHGLLAADVALNLAANSTKYAQWDAVVPSWYDIQQSMPLTWGSPLQQCLPPAALHVFAKQRANLDRDWIAVSEAFPFPDKDGIKSSCTRNEYLYAWMLVNTRTFYYVTPQTKKLPKEDHMALQPVADLFNHTDKEGCTVLYHHTSTFSFTSTKSYAKGDEVHISYGTHSNDFLLVEYGFVLAHNVWDEIRLDDAVLPALSQRQKDDLDDVGFLGNYVLDKDTVCHRTQIALRLVLTDSPVGTSISMDQWQHFVDGVDDGEKSQREADAILVSLLEDYDLVVLDKVKELKSLQFDESGSEALNESRRHMLLTRWDQIRRLVRHTVDRLR